MNKHATFSEAVLNRIRERRYKRTWEVMTFVFIVVIMVGGILLNYQLYQYKKRQTAPTWADFKVNPNDNAEHAYEKVQATLEGVPLVLHINGQRWDVVKVDEFKDAYDKPGGELFNGTQAQTDCEHHLITYVKTDDPITLRTNLMHEVYHAGACIHGGATWWNSEEATLDKHPGIYHLGDFSTDFIRQNPVFIKWMLENE